jgi:endogenous inhibitor of DNA gyrase (YacG/DUF329 family)
MRQVEKSCAHCGQPFVDMIKGRNTGRRRFCSKRCSDAAYTAIHKEQKAAYDKEYRTRGPGKRTARAREWQVTHPERRHEIVKASHLRRQYGLELETFKAAIIAQRNLCEVCGEPNQRAGATYLVVDHCHDKGHVRGFICDACNKTLGGAKDNPATLRALADYLERDAERQRITPFINFQIPPPDDPSDHEANLKHPYGNPTSTHGHRR